ncbi:MAG: ABC transporter permease [Nitrospira sp.]|nr:ABC transporter permease [Nitrospira sp.]MBX3337317.1 ABC transporter permease [Nitrospira sp.]MCW5780486.1 ABC transporter permease [Nitrospira sp.]HNA25769.1 ABC transporter permease [Nitrospira sp.]
MESAVAQESSGPLVIEPREGYVQIGWRELWDARELFYFLAWRDLKTRYAQTAIGASWALMQPLLSTLIFTLVFSYLAKVPSDGLPYPLFAFAAILPWSLFARSLERSTLSVVTEGGLIKKVYFPRLIIPMSSTFINLVDFGVGMLILIGLMAWYQVVPQWTVVFLPLFVGVALLAALSVSLWLSALNVKYRDVASVVPLITQLWMFASPVLYPASLVPESIRWYYGLNPMAGVIEGFRWTLFGKTAPDWSMVGVSLAVVMVSLMGGLMFFRRVERTFADVI